MALPQPKSHIAAARRGTPAPPARPRQPARPLHAGGSPRISLPGRQHVARRHGADRAGCRQRRRARHRLCRPSRPPGRPDRAAAPERLRHDDLGDPAQARHARRPAHLARQPQHPQPAGRSPPRPFRAEDRRRPPDHAERHQYRRADHRHLAVRRRHRHRANAPRSAATSRSARSPAAWSAISKQASRSSSRGCSIRTRSKRTRPHSKRGVSGFRRPAAVSAARQPRRHPSPLADVPRSALTAARLAHARRAPRLAVACLKIQFYSIENSSHFTQIFEELS